MAALRIRRLERGVYFKYALLLPAVIWVVAFTFLPLISVIRYSFSSYVMGEGITGFVGFDNYVEVLTSARFWHSIMVTVIYVVVAVPIELVLGFLAAWLVNLGAPGSRTLQHHHRRAAVYARGRDRLSRRDVLHRPGRADRRAARLRSAFASPGCRPPMADIAAAILLDVWRWTSFIFIIVLAGLAGILERTL